MKTQADIEATRERLRRAMTEFSEHFNMPNRGSFDTPEQQWLFGLGALAFSNFALDLPRPDNLGRLIESMEATNKQQRESTNADADRPI